MIPFKFKLIFNQVETNFLHFFFCVGIKYYFSCKVLFLQITFEKFNWICDPDNNEFVTNCFANTLDEIFKLLIWFWIPTEIVDFIDN